MTDEELKSIEQTTALLVENGFVIKDTSNFIREIGNSNLKDIVNKLSELQKSINEGVNAEIFGKDIAVSLDSIEEVVNSDVYFKNSPEAASFENLLNNLRDKSSRLFRNTLKAEEILKNREENLKDIEHRISKLKFDKTIDDVTRTTETVKLSYALNHARNAREEALKFYNDQKALSSAPLMADDIVEYKNELLVAVNALDSASRKLSMDPTKMDVLATNIRETRDKIVLFGFETQKNQKEYDRLCAKYGLDKKDNIKVAEEIAKEKPIVETVISDKTVNSESKVEKSNYIANLEDLISEIKRLNPEVEIVNDEVLTEDPSKLALPDGFKYTEGLGINNKKNDLENYINAFVKSKEKELNNESIEKSIDSENVKQEENKVKKESKIPSGRLAVKRTRRAIVAPYVKAILCYGSLGGLMVAAAGVGLSPIGAGMIVGAGVGVIGQKIYNKMIDCGAVEVPHADLQDPSYELPVVGSYILQDAKNLLKSLRNNKNKKKKEALENAQNYEAEREVQEQIAETVSEIKNTEVKAPEIIEEEKKDELYENFKDMLSSNLDNEVDSLENKTVEDINNLNSVGGMQSIPVEQYFVNSMDEYDFNKQSRGGRL